jgi:hypothetical protein
MDRYCRLPFACCQRGVLLIDDLYDEDALAMVTVDVCEEFIAVETFVIVAVLCDLRG